MKPFLVAKREYVDTWIRGYVDTWIRGYVGYVDMWSSTDPNRGRYRIQPADDEVDDDEVDFDNLDDEDLDELREDWATLVIIRSTS